MSVWQDWQAFIAGEDSAIYGCGCNSCGCNLRLFEVRSESFEVDLGPVWDTKGLQKKIALLEREVNILHVVPTF